MKRYLFTFMFLTLLIFRWNQAAKAQSETPIAPPPGSWKGNVSGKLVNQTPGGSISGPIDVMLHGWDQNGNQALMLHGKSEADGTYNFSDVDFQSGVQVTAMASYEDAAYYSDYIDLQPGQTSLDLTVPIYETTSDLAGVSIEAMHLLFYLEDQSLTVTEVYVLGNQSNRTVKDVVELPRDRKATLKFPLPQDAKNVTFDTQESDRFVLLPDGFADTAPLTPGSHSSQVVVKFNLPYQGKLDYTFQPPVPVQSISLLVPQESMLSIQGEGLVSQGTQAMQETNFALYTGQSLKTGDQLHLTLSGSGKQATAQVLISSNSSLIIGAGALGLAFVIVGIYWWRKSEAATDEDGDEVGEDTDAAEVDDGSL